MGKQIATWFWAAVTALALNLFGCGATPGPVAGNGDDAGQVGNDQPQTIDAGMPVVDAGSPAADVGNDVLEASAGVPPLTDELQYTISPFGSWWARCTNGGCNASMGRLVVGPYIRGGYDPNKATLGFEGMGATLGNLSGVTCDRVGSNAVCSSSSGFACTPIDLSTVMNTITCSRQEESYTFEGGNCVRPDCSPTPRR